MRDASLVGLVQPLRHLLDDLQRLVDLERSGVQPLLERLALVERHGKEESPLVRLADVEDRADVVVVECRRRLRFLDEARLRARIPSQLRRQKLERHLAAEARVLGLVDLAHPACAEARENPIVGDLVADHLKLADTVRPIRCGQYSRSSSARFPTPWAAPPRRPEEPGRPFRRACGLHSPLEVGLLQIP